MKFEEPHSAPAAKQNCGGRPRKQVDRMRIVDLASVGCTQEEIARKVGVSVDTLHLHYADAIEDGWTDLRISMRRAQVKAALRGNPTMLIWEGKQILGQRDQPLPSDGGNALDETLKVMRQAYEDNGEKERLSQRVEQLERELEKARTSASSMEGNK